MSPPRVVAEVGCNHKGELAVALEMIEVAADFCGVDVVKFQKRTPRQLLSAAQYAAPHPDPAHAYGSSYGEHRERLELDGEQHRVLAARCAERGVGYACSVWDLTAAEEVVALDPCFVKVPSALNLHADLLGYLCAHYHGPIHLSTGMTTRAEERRIVELLERAGRLGDVVLYSCTSGYPVAFEDVSLLEITRLQEDYGDRVAAVGFSGHHLGIAADVAAMTLGAAWVERHFTLDRTWKGTDHAASLEPDGMRRLARDLRHVAQALRYKEPEILPVEEAQRRKLKWLPEEVTT